MTSEFDRSNIAAICLFVLSELQTLDKLSLLTIKSVRFTSLSALELGFRWCNIWDQLVSPTRTTKAMKEKKMEEHSEERIHVCTLLLPLVWACSHPARALLSRWLLHPPEQPQQWRCSANTSAKDIVTDEWITHVTCKVTDNWIPCPSVHVPCLDLKSNYFIVGTKAK